MLIYRLIHFKDPIPDIDINIQRRNKELCKPCIQLFYGTPVQEKLEQTFQTFLDIKNRKRARSLEAILIPVVIKMVEEEGKRSVPNESGNTYKIIFKVSFIVPMNTILPTTYSIGVQ
jgi:hypothetical protein